MGAKVERRGELSRFRTRFAATSGDSHSDPCDPISGSSSGPLTTGQVPVTVPLGYRFTGFQPPGKEREIRTCLSAPDSMEPFTRNSNGLTIRKKIIFSRFFGKIINRLLECTTNTFENIIWKKFEQRRNETGCWKFNIWLIGHFFLRSSFNYFNWNFID